MGFLLDFPFFHRYTLFMSLLELLLVAVGLSMDAFAVAICKGLSIQQEHQKRSVSHSIYTGVWFGVFQGGMPLIGYFIGARFSNLVGNFDHWIVFILLALIGGKMIKESREADSCPNPSFKPLAMLPLAVATSIDALAVGVSFAFLNVNVIEASSIIAATTFLLSAIGVQVGCFFGSRFKSRAELAGGLVLIAIGTKILIEHLLG
jgi:manganese efflux pump family protein